MFPADEIQVGEYTVVFSGIISANAMLACIYSLTKKDIHDSKLISGNPHDADTIVTRYANTGYTISLTSLTKISPLKNFIINRLGL